MKRFLVVAMIFGIVSVAQAEMPGASLLKSIPFLKKSDAKTQEKTTETSNDGAQKNEGGAAPSESPGASFLKSIPFFNKPDPSNKPDAATQDKQADKNPGGETAAQAKTPKEFIAIMPKLPTDICSAGNKEKETYLANVSDFVAKLKAEIYRNRQESKKASKASEEALKKNMMAKSGMSAADAEKMKSAKKMSREEKLAMADKLMQKKAGVSMQEAKDLQQMDKSGQEKWGNEHMTKRMASGGLNSEQAKADQQFAARGFELSKESKELTDKITARLEKGRARLDDFNKKETPKAEAMYEAEISPILKQMEKHCGGGIYEEAKVRECERLRKLLDAAQDRYCSQFGPKQRDALLDVQKSYEAVLPDYSRLEQIEDERIKLLAGGTLNKTPVQPGQLGLEAILEYSEMLDSAYKFNLRENVK